MQSFLLQVFRQEDNLRLSVVSFHKKIRNFVFEKSLSILKFWKNPLFSESNFSIFMRGKMKIWKIGGNCKFWGHKGAIYLHIMSCLSGSVALSLFQVHFTLSTILKNLNQLLILTLHTFHYRNHRIFYRNHQFLLMKTKRHAACLSLEKFHSFLAQNVFKLLMPPRQKFWLFI